MECPNCGFDLKQGEKVCPICQTNSQVIIENNNKYEEYKENEELKQKYGFNKWLILSILEICCCNQIFGLVAIILLFLKLKTSIEQRNFEEANKWEHNIKIILIIGICFGILLGVFQLVINLVPMII